MLRAFLHPIHPQSLFIVIPILYAELFYIEEVSFASFNRVFSQAATTI